MSYVLDLLKFEQDQANYLEEGLRNEIKERMTVTGREPHKEVVQMALRAEKLTTENRRIRTEFAKRRNSPTFSGQSSKRGRDLTSIARSTTSASVASTRPPSQQSQSRSSRFDRPVMSSQGRTSKGLDRCLTEDEARARPSIVTGTMIVFDRDAHVLIDSGFDRSYLSISFASFSDRNLSPLEEEIIVHTPLGERLVRNTYYRDCGIKVGEEKFMGNLIPLEIRDFNLILGIDWLSTHRAKVDCFKKEVILQSSEGAEVVFTEKHRVLPFCVVSALKALKLVRKGYPAYLAHVIDISREEPKLENVPVVSEFPDVFPDELPGLPPDREFKFTIDLLPGTAPISIPPYRMAPAELKELKVQLQELVDKGFIHPSMSP
ncbi:hypothetical protein QQP08_020789 [Theobroma cacao]|nr:hypothetical protein QQP08_020787 [Theobroma cacao]WRX28302.1 hypothetical protein QQP08_020789 [Theobroma cacao]